MTCLSSIPGIEKTSLELLEAAGFLDIESLATAGVDQLSGELTRANKVLEIAPNTPTRSEVENWVSFARDLLGTAGDTSLKRVILVNDELSPEVASMLAIAPFAIPLSARLLKERELSVADLPAAIFLNRHSGDLEMLEDEKVFKAPQNRVSNSGNFLKIADHSPARVELNSTRFKTTDDMLGGSVKPITRDSGKDNDRVSLIRRPRVETNKGRDPQSPFYIRGVLHSHPVSMVMGAIVTLILAVVLPLAIVSAALLLLSDLRPEQFSWVPKWLLAFPFSLPVAGLAYLIFGFSGSCRICGQRQFVPRMCLKNSKAHHVRGLGYIVPVCVHMLLFKWFRCTYCGTPVRLKK